MGNNDKKETDDITRLQRKAVKLIDNTVPTDKVFIKHRILPFEQLVQLEQCKLGYKLCNNLLPQNLAKKYETRSQYAEHHKNSQVSYSKQTHPKPSPCPL